MKLKGKVALVTGAGSGIGKAVALAVAKEGARVGVNDIREDAAAVVAEEINRGGGNAVAAPGDVSSLQDVEGFVQAVTSAFGPIDVLVNNAGVQTETLFWEISEETWDWVIRTNLKGTFLCSRTVAKQMIPRKCGRIINMSSVHQEIPREGIAHYAASKGGIHMLTKVMALELAPYGINVNCVAPGAIRTAMNQRLLDSPDALTALERTIPRARIGQPVDVAPAVIYLASDEADYVTGSTILVDGGLSMVAYRA